MAPNEPACYSSHSCATPWLDLGACFEGIEYKKVMGLVYKATGASILLALFYSLLTCSQGSQMLHCALPHGKELMSLANSQ